MISQEDIPKHWKIKKANQVGEVVTGGTPDTNTDEYWGGDIPWLRVSDLGGGLFVSDSEDMITKEGLHEGSCSLLKQGSVVIATRATIGKVAIAGTKLATNQGFKSIEPSDKINNKFLAYYLMSISDYLQSLGKGATFDEVNKTQIENLDVPVPPLDEQEHIVEVVEERLERVERLEKSVENVGRLADEYQDSFTVSLLAGLDNLNDNVDIQSLGDLIPDNWEMKTFGEVIQSSLYGCNPETGEDIDGVPYLRISDIREDGGLKYRQLPEKARFEKDSDREKYSLEDGDIVIARSGASCGQSYVYQEEHGRMVYASYLIRFKLNQEIVKKDYIRAYLSSPIYWEQVNSSEKGAAQNNINAGSIKSFKIPVPPLETQQEIISSLREIDYSSIQRASNDLGDLFEEYRNSVLRNAFQGQINH